MLQSQRSEAGLGVELDWAEDSDLLLPALARGSFNWSHYSAWSLLVFPEDRRRRRRREGGKQHLVTVHSESCLLLVGVPQLLLWEPGLDHKRLTTYCVKTGAFWTSPHPAHWFAAAERNKWINCCSSRETSEQWIHSQMSEKSMIFFLLLLLDVTAVPVQLANWNNRKRAVTE